MPTTRTRPSAADMTFPWRLELQNKSVSGLKKQITFLHDHPNICALNIPHKTKTDDLRKALRIVAEDLPRVKDICVHVSIKNLYHKTAQDTYRRLAILLNDLDTLAKQHDLSLSILLVSGSGSSRRKLNTVTALEELRREPLRDRWSIRFAIAFNPYLTSSQDRQEEFQRLGSKFEAMPSISAVYLQIGTDSTLFHRGIDHLETFKAASNGSLRIYGSCLVPNRRLLSSMRFRPWRGVHLSEAYLSSVASADAVTGDMLRLYAQRRISPLVETAIDTKEELSRAHGLLGRHWTE